MSLSSPRFAGVPELQQAASNSPYMSSGAKGIGVHLVQFALIDLGYAMPKSTGGSGLSPDGVYGSETVEKLKEFQRSTKGGPAVTDDGVLGANTMAKLDNAIGGYTHRVSIEVMTTVTPNVPFIQSLSIAQELYGHYGIKLEVLSGLTVSLNAADTAVMEKWHPFDRRQARAIIRGSSSMCPGPDHIVVVFIDKFDANDNWGGTTSGVNGAISRIVKDAGQDTLAHELGHVLLESTSPAGDDHHHPHTHNIMTDGWCTAPYVLSLDQVTRMRAAPRCR